jgi:hypothetical protein
MGSNCREMPPGRYSVQHRYRSHYFFFASMSKSHAIDLLTV